MASFEEIAHTGGKLTFIYENNTIAVRFVHSSPIPATAFQVCISPEGEVVDFVAFSGEGGRSFYPQPSILAILLSDREGMFGQKCRSCDSYFRTSVLSRTTTCPYCGFRNHGRVFLTENQLKYLTSFFNTYIDVQNERLTKEVDLDKMIDQLPNNTQAWVYKEESQQSKTRCSSCRCVYDVLGRYALCPVCALPNYESSFQNGLEVVRVALAAAPDHLDLPGETFSRSFTEYEALANAVRRQLLRLPMTPRRRKDIEKINFQRLLEAFQSLDQYFGFRVTDGLSEDDLGFLKVAVNRRHILIHEAGRVDERYLQQTGDASVRLNETLHVNMDDATRTLALLWKCGTNLLSEWRSMTSGQPNISLKLTP